MGLYPSYPSTLPLGYAPRPNPYMQSLPPYHANPYRMMPVTEPHDPLLVEAGKKPATEPPAKPPLPQPPPQAPVSTPEQPSRPGVSTVIKALLATGGLVAAGWLGWRHLIKVDTPAKPAAKVVSDVLNRSQTQSATRAANIQSSRTQPGRRQKVFSAISAIPGTVKNVVTFPLRHKTWALGGVGLVGLGLLGRFTGHVPADFGIAFLKEGCNRLAARLPDFSKWFSRTSV